jgi:hypothetical protein
MWLWLVVIVAHAAGAGARAWHIWRFGGHNLPHRGKALKA